MDGNNAMDRTPTPRARIKLPDKFVSESTPGRDSVEEKCDVKAKVEPSQGGPCVGLAAGATPRNARGPIRLGPASGGAAPPTQATVAQVKVAMTRARK